MARTIVRRDDISESEQESQAQRQWKPPFDFDPPRKGGLSREKTWNGIECLPKKDLEVLGSPYEPNNDREYDQLDKRIPRRREHQAPNIVEYNERQSWSMSDKKGRDNI